MLDEMWEGVEVAVWLVERIWLVLLIIGVAVIITCVVMSHQNDAKDDCRAKGGIPVTAANDKIVCTTGVIK